MAFLRYGKVNHVLRPGATLLGRAAYCDVSFDDPEVSKEHALLVGADGGWTLIDLKSTNGTYVSDGQILHAVLRDGDRIRVGASDFHFFLETADESSEHGALFAEVWALGEGERASQIFPAPQNDMARLFRLARPWVLDRIGLMARIVEATTRSGFEGGVLEVAAEVVGARRGRIRRRVGDDWREGLLRFDGYELPVELAGTREATVGPTGAFEEGIVPEPGEDPEDDSEGERLRRSPEPYLFLPFDDGGELYLEDPSEKRRFDEEDLIAARELWTLAMKIEGRGEKEGGRS